MKQQQTTTDRAALRAPEFFPELGSLIAEIGALDQRLAQIQTRRTELNAALTVAPPPEAQGASVLDRARACCMVRPSRRRRRLHCSSRTPCARNLHSLPGNPTCCRQPGKS